MPVLASNINIESSIETTYYSDETLSIQFNTPGTIPRDSLRVYISPYSTDNQIITGHRTIPDLNFVSATGSNGFTVNIDIGKNLYKGASYLIIASLNHTIFSRELIINTLIRKVPQVDYIDNNNRSSIKLGWKPTGAPAYHLLVSETPFKINNSGLLLENAEVIWQTITDKNDIVLGEDTHVFNHLLLDQHKNYYVLLANNYDGLSTEYTDFNNHSITIAYPMTEQDTLDSLDSLDLPEMTSPIDNQSFDVTRNNSIRFEWITPQSAIKHYRFVLFENKVVSGIRQKDVIFESQLNNNFINLSIQRYFKNTNYSCKAYYHFDDGSVTSTDDILFSIEQEVGSLTINTTATLEGQSIALEAVDIDIVSLNSGLPIQMRTANLYGTKGSTSTTLPPGEYQMILSKTGYYEKQIQFYLAPNENKSISIQLNRYPYQLFGRTLSDQYDPLANTAIDVTNATSTSKETYYSDFRGFFLAHMNQGRNKIEFNHPSHNDLTTTYQTFNTPNFVNIDTIFISHFHHNLSGEIKDESGNLLSGINVSISDINRRELQRTISDANGFFSFNLSPGNYYVNIRVPGYGEKNTGINFNQDRFIPIQLQSQANSVRGIVYSIHQVTRDSLVKKALPNIPVFAADIDETDPLHDTIWHHTHDDGSYIFFLDNSVKNWNIVAMNPTNQLRDSTQFIIENNSIHSKIEDILFNNDSKQASIRGTITSSDTIDTNHVQIMLMNSEQTEIYETQKPYIKDSQLQFEFSNLSRGTYVINGATDGYSVTSDPVIINFDNQDTSTTIGALTLLPTNNTMTFNTFYNAQNIPSEVYITYPAIIRSNSGTAISNISSGVMINNYFPTDTSVIPLIDHLLNVSNAANINIDYIALHNHVLNLPDTNQLTLQLQTTQPVSSATITVIEDNSFKTTTPINLSRSSDSIAVFNPNIRSSTKSIHYYFDIYTNNLHYSNQTESKHFFSRIDRSRDSIFFETPFPSTINTLTSHTLKIPLHLSGKINGSITLNNSNLQIQSSSANSIIQFNENEKLLIITTSASPESFNINLSATGAGTSTSKTFQITTHKKPINKVIPHYYNNQNKYFLSGDSIHYLFRAIDTTSQNPVTYYVSPEITVTPEGSMLDSAGYLQVATNFIGEAELNLKVSQYKFSQSLVIHHKVRRFNTQKSLFIDSISTLILPDSSLISNDISYISINKFDTKKFSSIPQNKNPYTNFLALSYLNSVPLDKAPTIEFQIQEQDNDETTEFFPTVYDNKLKKWNIFTYTNEIDTIVEEIIDTTEEITSLLKIPSVFAANIDSSFFEFNDRKFDFTLSLFDDYYYGLLTNLQDNSREELTIIPNPFSPYVTAFEDQNTLPGTRISFTPYSQYSNQISVSIHIYNLAGELVKTLMNNRIFRKEKQDIYWDGFSDDGLLLRNGRYLLRYTSKDINNNIITEDIIKSIVLFK